MATHIGIGFSQHKDSMAAAQEAAQQAKEQLNKSRIDFALIFNSVHYAPEEILPVVFKTLDQTKMIGTSTAGIILSNRVETRGVAVLIFHSDNIIFETGFISHLDLQDRRRAGEAFGQNAVTDWGQRHRKAFLFFVDGLLNNLTDLTSGLSEKLGHFFPLIGAGSTDNLRFQRTFQYQKEKYFSQGAVGLILGGNPILELNCKHGWKPLGKPRTVTDVQGNIIKKINKKSALAFYREYFAQQAESLKSNRLGQINIRYPLGILSDTNKEYMLRNVVSVLDDESIVCQDNVNKDSTVHLMIGNKETCLRSAEQAALELKEQLGGRRPSVVLVLESILRYKLLGRSAQEEISIIQNIMGERVPLFGMYSYGEIVPTKTSENNFETVVNHGSIILIAIG